MSDLQDRVRNLSAEQQALFRTLLEQKGLSVDIIPKRRTNGPMPLSFAQQRLWFMDQFTPSNYFYNEPLFAIRLMGALNLFALERAFHEIVRRHEVLRTRFISQQGSPLQVIEESSDIDVNLVDFTCLAPAIRETQLQSLALHEARYCFDLSAGRLMRICLVRLEQKEHVVLLEMHHIISDGWTLRLLLREIALLYESFVKGEESPLAELPVQYADYALWQREWLQGAVLEEQLAYWEQQLAAPLPVLQLPTDRARPAVQSYGGGRARIELDRSLSEALRRLSREQGVTLFMMLLAGFVTLLQRYSGQEEVVVGTPIANRNRSEIEGLIGFFANTLALRVGVGGNPRFVELLKRVQEVTLGAYAHQDLPFEKLVEVLQPERDLSYSPLFQVLFGLHNYPIETLQIQGLTFSRMEIDAGESKFDLAVSVSDLGEAGLRVQGDYSTDLFEAATITRLLRRYEKLLQSVVERADARINTLRIDQEIAAEQKLTNQEEFLLRLKNIKRKAITL